MKVALYRVAALVVLVAVLAALPLWTAEAQTNLLVNPGFEQGLEGWSWYQFNPYVVTNPVHSGNYAVAMGNTKSTYGYQSVYQHMPYTVTIWSAGAWFYIPSGCTYPEGAFAGLALVRREPYVVDVVDIAFYYCGVSEYYGEVYVYGKKVASFTFPTDRWFKVVVDSYLSDYYTLNVWVDGKLVYSGTSQNGFAFHEYDLVYVGNTVPEKWFFVDDTWVYDLSEGPIR